MFCLGCGGSDLEGTCVCSYEFQPESDMSRRKLTKDERARRMDILTDGCDGYDDEPIPDLEREERIRKGSETGFCEGCNGAYLACTCDDESAVQPKQICHFCGVDLWLQRIDLNIRMCVPCGLALNHEECCRCIVCNKTWLVDECIDVASGSVCQICRSL